MHNLTLELDHVGVAVRSLDQGQRAYERLGFHLTPRSLHSGAVTPGGPVVPWGSGNHCGMFRRGYLEILGVTDPALHSSAKGLLEDYEGLHIVAFGVADADRAFAALNAVSPGINPVRALERDAAFGADGRETRRAAFRNVYTDRTTFPEARFIFIEHSTPDVLWQPHLLGHPNGEVETLYEDPTGELLSRPTNVAIGEGRLYVANLGGWHVTVIERDIAPGPLYLP